jgi:hypothetical protein
MTEQTTPTHALTPGAPRLAPEDVELIRSMATLFIDVLRPFGVAMARHLHEQEPRLGALDDAEAVEATRASCESNLREIFSMLRAGLPTSAHETPVQALTYARFLRARGTGYDSVVVAYEYGVAMFRAVLGLELQARLDDPTRIAAIAQAADEFLFAYIGRTFERLLFEYDLTEGAWYPSSADPVFAHPACADAARRFRDEQISRGEWLPASAELSRAHADSERVLEAFAATIEEAASHTELGRRLANADTTVEVTLADEPDLAVVLLLNRSPIEVLVGPGDAEARLRIASFDLANLYSEDFQLSMAIVRGRVAVSGPVRKFLRVVPILRPLAARYRALAAGEPALAGARDVNENEPS